MASPLLRITDGTYMVDLLSSVGFHVEDWVPMRAPLKGGGVWQDSPLANGRRLVLYKAENIIDTWNIVANHYCQDDLIKECQDADRLLLEAIDYQTASWMTVPVWIEARGPEETNTRYALIHAYSMPNDDNPYGQPFWTQFAKLAFDEMTLVVEHGPWLELPPGDEACVEVSAQAIYNIAASGMAPVYTTYGRAASGTCAASVSYLLQEDGSHIDLEDLSGSLLLEGGASALGEVFVANKHNLANLTHVYYNDGGAWSGNLQIAMYPYAILPAVPANGDYIAFGISTAVADSGPFCSLIFDIMTGSAPTGGASVTWQYTTGAGPAWATFPSASLTDNTDYFANTGVNGVHWKQPSDWASVALNGVTAYWVRALINVPGGGSFTQPWQQNRYIYTVPWARAEVDAAQVPGDIPAWAHLITVPRSPDADTNLQFDRLTVGLRSDRRGTGFAAYLNCAEEQNPPGITASLEAPGIFQTRSEGPCGFAGRFAALAFGNTVTARWTFDSGAVSTYRGTYHAYARVHQYGGNADSLVATLQAGVLDAGTYYQLWEGEPSVPVSLVGGTVLHTLVDLGRVTLPPTTPPDPVEQMQVRLLLENADPAMAALSVDVWDLVLIPTDEWAGTFLEPTSGPEVDYRKRLEVDSVTDPKRYIKAQNTGRSSGNLIAPYEPITNGPMILQANASQRLWFLAALNGNSDPAICSSVRLARIARYQSMRGDR